MKMNKDTCQIARDLIMSFLAMSVVIGGGIYVIDRVMREKYDEPISLRVEDIGGVNINAIAEEMEKAWGVPKKISSSEFPLEESQKLPGEEKIFFNTPYTFPNYLEQKRKDDSINPILEDQLLPNKPEDGKIPTLKKGEEAKGCKVDTAGNKRVIATQAIPKEPTKVQVR